MDETPNIGNASTALKHCPYCGSPNEADAITCAGCGTPLEASKKAVSQPLPPTFVAILNVGGLVLIFGALLLITGRAFGDILGLFGISHEPHGRARGVYSFYTSLTLAPFVFLLTIPAIIAFCRARYQSRRAWIVAGVTLLVCAGFAVLPRIEPFVAAFWCLPANGLFEMAGVRSGVYIAAAAQLVFGLGLLFWTRPRPLDDEKIPVNPA